MAVEQLEEEEDEGKGVLEYTCSLKERIHTLWEEVRRQMERAQEKKKGEYDQSSRVRQLRVGSKALILLPSSDNKAQVTPVTCKLQVPRKRQMSHINPLKEWEEAEEPPATSHAVLQKTDAKPLEITMPPQTKTRAQQTPNIVENPTKQQVRQIEDLISRNKDVFSYIPGRTTLTEHNIQTETGKVIWLRPYRMPKARYQAIEEEVSSMLEGSITEPS
ncbi:hypothetical protein NDU88_002868 [Pleurodeles waltl]|uniref:Uncharacterized protein n=1 Tax=Pleurodeles waltl TaxID=8319 RepID=A0AAV7TMZ7_PLEWA|nr:hypothetical protein NDU88_002868 [Pleurodeles waltl]